MNSNDNNNNDRIMIDTKDALGLINGKQIHANYNDIQNIKNHIINYKTLYNDLRIPIRNIENILLNDPLYIGTLIGNQCIDFYKQDGITEIEESILANTIERRLNDILFDTYDNNNSIIINRQSIYVSTVSNFTNFLDLFRKTIRSLEIGIPVIILCRSNTSQHSYRWTKLLNDLIIQQNNDNFKDRSMYIDPGMITFISCSLNDIKSILYDCSNHTGNLYATCSRELASQIKNNYYNTIASTGGPNTLIYTPSSSSSSTTSSTTSYDIENDNNISKLYNAIRISSSIECAGQCTALRHVVLPSTISYHDIEHHVFNTKNNYNDIQEIPSALYALENKIFTGIYPNHQGTISPPTSTTDDLHNNHYIKTNDMDIYYKINDMNQLPESNMNEYWRKVVIDFTRLDITNDDYDHIHQLAKWLRMNQPISIAMNGKRMNSITIGIQLWELTSCVVNTIGSIDNNEMPVALSCQARPQDGEVFGEFPPRNDMLLYTKYPMIIPSSNPSYDSYYNIEYLKKQYNSDSINTIIQTSYSKEMKHLLNVISDEVIGGYCIEIIEYIRDVCRMNPKFGNSTTRTSLYGIQRPPLGSKSIIRCTTNTTYNDIAPILLLFRSTTARNQIIISIDPSNEQLISFFMKHNNLFTNTNSNDNNDDNTDNNVDDIIVIESDLLEKSNNKDNDNDIFHIIQMDSSFTKQLKTFPLVGQFVSLFLPLGHIKSTMPNDQEFVLKVRLSKKWLGSLF